MDLLYKEAFEERPVEHESAELMLDEGGMILDCSDSGEKLFGYSRSELIKQHVSRLLPQLSKVKLVENGKLDSQLGFFCHCGRLFQVQSRLRGTFLSELNFILLSYAGMSILRLIVSPLGNVRL
jgi:PAS domain S-box-containing protein